MKINSKIFLKTPAGVHLLESLQSGLSRCIFVWIYFHEGNQDQKFSFQSDTFSDGIHLITAPFISFCLFRQLYSFSTFCLIHVGQCLMSLFSLTSGLHAPKTFIALTQWKKKIKGNSNSQSISTVSLFPFLIVWYGFQAKSWTSIMLVLVWIWINWMQEPTTRKTR